MRHYVTLFDKNYLTKGVSLYQSLIRHSSEDFRLWVLALDGHVGMYLRHLIKNNVLTKMEVVDLARMPDEVYQQKRARPWNYFCFGLAPEFLMYMMHDLNQPVTYLDADTYFFQDPKLVFDEMGDREVGIVDHNFPRHDYDRLIVNGKFNVSLVSFTTSPLSRQLLKAWRDGVRKKCDKESCGDQLFLDQFPNIMGDRLHIFDGIRIGAAPWNVYTYKTEPGPKVQNNDLIYYHYHEFKDTGNGNYYYTGYPLTFDNIEYIYKPYLECYKRVQVHIDKKRDEGFFYGY